MKPPGRVGNEMQRAIDRFEGAVRDEPTNDGYYYAFWWTLRGLVAWWLAQNADEALVKKWKEDTR